MTPSPNDIRRKNPLLIWVSDDDISDIIFLLDEEGFVWIKEKESFYCEKKNFYIKAEDFNRYICNQEALRGKIRERDNLEEEDNLSENVEVANNIINILIAAIILNLFLGFMFFHFIVWLILELMAVFLLISFVNVRKKIIKKIEKQTNACR